MSAAVFEERADPGRIASALLALAVHVLLIAVLVFGVRWQNRLPESVQVELWEPQQIVRASRPVVESPKPVETPPPRPEPKIEKPDIVEKAPPPKPEAKKPAPKPEATPEPLKPRVDDSRRRFQEQVDRERQLLAIDQERAQIREQSAKDSSAVRSRALAEWKEKVSASIYQRILQEIARAVPGNPEAVYEVILFPNCEVREMRKIKSSGNAAYDDEIERAISYYKKNALPKPDKPDLFESRLTIRFRPSP
jgi:colicin import membrane protein